MTGGGMVARAWRLARIPAWCVAGLAIATAAVMALGHAVYIANGRPNNHATVSRTTQSRTFAFMAAPQANPSRLVARLGVDMAEEALLAGASSGPWQAHPSGGGALGFRDSAHAAYDTGANGVVRQVRIIVPHTQASSIQHLATRLNQIWGPPTASVHPVSTTPPADAVSLWETAAGQILLDARETRFPGEFTLHIVLTSDRHPLAGTRRATGGLAPYHRHAGSMRAALAELDREAVPPRGNPPQPRPTPARLDVDAARDRQSLVPGRRGPAVGQ